LIVAPKQGFDVIIIIGPLILSGDDR